MSLNVTLTRAGAALHVLCNTALATQGRRDILRMHGYHAASGDSDLLQVLAPALLEQTTATPLVIIGDEASIFLGGTPIEEAEVVVVDACREYDPSAKFFTIDGGDNLVEMYAIAESPAS
jgi:hypothetical protein